DSIITNSIDGKNNDVQSMSTQLMHDNKDKIKLLFEIDDIIKFTNLVDNNNGSTQIFEEYKSILLDALKIVQEQENANNIQWTQSVQGSFRGIQNLVTDIQSYRRRLTNP
ncbi:5968_t:CDS:2, partial [Cetraspora pellucida]